MVHMHRSSLASNIFLERPICYDNEKIPACLTSEGTQLLAVTMETVNANFLAKVRPCRGFSDNSKLKKYTSQISCC